MKCTNCMQELPTDATQCNRCGMPVTQTPAFATGYSAPQDPPLTPEQGGRPPVEGKPQAIEFLAVPESRLIWLSVLTFGFYLLYWVYKNWQAFRKFDQSKITPFWRTMFFPFFTHGMFKRILDEARQVGYQMVYNPWPLAIFFVILMAGGHRNGRERSPQVGQIMDLIDVIFGLLSVLPILPVQKAINFYHEQTAPGTPLRTKFTTGEIIMVAAGIILAALSVLAVISPGR